MQLSEHFSLAEFTESPTAEARGIDNAKDAPIETLTHLAQNMERVRSLLRGCAINVDSAYRSPKLNAAVGGVPDSAHMQGHACDFTCPTFGSPYYVAEFLSRALPHAGIKFDQLIHEQNVWVHIAFQDVVHGQRGELLTLEMDGSYSTGINPV
jgi:zinc D-Ala-D-Ala carboxypeptidase